MSHWLLPPWVRALCTRQFSGGSRSERAVGQSDRHVHPHPGTCVQRADRARAAWWLSEQLSLPFAQPSAGARG